ncbi:ferritin-like domain-containing protein [Roseobacter fucihabitans]|uniref:ferritin-like domain-containing protein n=1 Tax=Roseobacter fucihabitans TaxID=1537242 RepID=UPI00292A4636|nr:ferritin-like domain-containing protein [Roseobacter litoralis]
MKSRIPRKYIVCIFDYSPLIRMSSRNRWRSAGIYWSDIETSYRQIEKVPIVQQDRQFTKSQHLDQRASTATSTHTARAVSSIVANSAAQDDAKQTSAGEMCNDLADDNERVAHRLRTLIKIAGEDGDPVTEDMAMARAAHHEKAAWMLRSLVKS